MDRSQYKNIARRFGCQSRALSHASPSHLILMPVRLPLLSIAVLVAWTCALVADEPSLPAAAGRKVDFHREIVPILANSCAKCHAADKRKGGFSINTRESVLAGGESGPAVVSGSSAESRLIQLVAGLEPDSVMPAQGPRLTSAQIGLLRSWIDEGLPWESGFTLNRVPPAPLEPRRVSVPQIANLANPIDRLLAPYFTAAGFEPPALVDDRAFLRRAYFDLIGVPPSVADADAFLRDNSPDKRASLARKLLADNRQYAAHWLTFWND